MKTTEIACPTCARLLEADETLWADEYCQECWEKYCGHQFWEAMAGRQKPSITQRAEHGAFIVEHGGINLTAGKSRALPVRVSVGWFTTIGKMREYLKTKQEGQQ